ncbi:MAG: type II secretion system protein N, partial [Burkholderiales bacterium]|nr:type II secretion system protein N [Burkholderiales bacterium]
FFLPASWVGLALEKQTKGRVTLGDIQGSFWSGSAFVGVAADHYSAVTPLFQGRFSWKISPSILIGQLAVEIYNPQVMNAATQLEGNFSQWHLSPASLQLPPERLEGLGAPLNTIGPTGKIVLQWSSLEFTSLDGKLLLNGKMALELSEMASRLSSIRPLGSYALAFQWKGESADLVLKTSRGPMMLEGNGALQQGRFQFSGKAYAETGQEEKMASLLNLLGRRRQEGDKQVIALEYK